MNKTFRFWQQPHRLLTVAVLLTLVVRLVYGLFVFERIADRFSWRQDDEYSDIAYTLLTSGEYAVSESAPPTMKRLPLHPLILAGVYGLFGRSAVAVRVFQSLLCAMTCILIYLTAKDIAGDRVAGLAALLFALYPNSILYSARTLSEITYTFFLSILCLTLVRLFKSPGVWTSLSTGLSLGMLMLVRGTTVLLPPFLLLALLSAHYRERLWRLIGGLALMTFVAALILSPWVIRNYRLTGKIIPLSIWGGSPFYHGYYVATHLGDGRSGRQLDYDGAMEARRLVYERYEPVGQPIDEYHRDRIAYALVWEKIRAQPQYSSWMFLRNVVLVWFLTFGSTTTIVSALVHVPLLLLAGYALLVMLKQDRQTWIRALPLALIFIYFNLFHAVVYPHVRYLFPAIATTVTILAAYDISRLIARAGHLRARYLQVDTGEAGS